MRWKIGALAITKVVELETLGGTRFILPQASREEVRAIDWLYPHFADESGRLKLTIHSLIVETPTRRIVVDTGLGNDKQDRDVPTFPKARYLMNRAEFEYWRDRRESKAQIAVFEDSIRPVVETGLVDLVESDHRLCEEMNLIPTPGHSPGHVSVELRSGGEEALLTGDVLHHPCQMAHLDWASTVDFDAAQSTRTRETLFSRVAGTQTLVIGAHFAAGRVVRDGAAFRLVV